MQLTLLQECVYLLYTNIMKKYKNFKDFYPYYLTEHSDKTTKLFHFVGTSFSIMFLVYSSLFTNKTHRNVTFFLPYHIFSSHHSISTSWRLTYLTRKWTTTHQRRNTLYAQEISEKALLFNAVYNERAITIVVSLCSWFWCGKLHKIMKEINSQKKDLL